MAGIRAVKKKSLRAGYPADCLTTPSREKRIDYLSRLGHRTKTIIRSQDHRVLGVREIVSKFREAFDNCTIGVINKPALTCLAKEALKGSLAAWIKFPEPLPNRHLDRCEGEKHCDSEERVE